MSKAAFRAERINGVDCFVPMDDDGREMVAAARQRDKPLMLRGHPARNPRHHRLVFVLLRRIIDGGAWDGDEEGLLTYCKIGIGHVDTMIGPTGQVCYVPRSISYESLSQDKFRRVFDRMVYFLCSRLLGYDDWEALRDEIGRIVDGDLGERAREHDERFGGRAA